MIRVPPGSHKYIHTFFTKTHKEEVLDLLSCFHVIACSLIVRLLEDGYGTKGCGFEPFTHCNHGRNSNRNSNYQENQY
jgi:hypothetical protein